MLYTDKTPIISVDLLNGRPIPFFDEQPTSSMLILADREAEYCSKAPVMF